MSYTSFMFIVFVVILFCLYYILPKNVRKYVLLLGSIYFYYLFSGKYIIYIIICSFFTYLFGLLMDKVKKKKLFLGLSIFIIVSFLLVIKYDNFLSSLINPILNLVKLEIPYKKFIMPIGISYYTLEMISYLVDIYRKKINSDKNPFNLLLFFSFFPKIVEGPFCRYDDLGKTLFNGNKFDYEKIRKNFLIILCGLLKKMVIADRAALFVNTVFDGKYSGLVLFIAIVLYTIQIYFDFSGCIDIVTGVSGLFGVTLPKNFNRPFFSKTIDEFWRRWHITLGAWLKDYIFYPISFSKLNMKLNVKARKWKNKFLGKFVIIAFPLLFVWFFNGLWHGASFKYILYGLYYYVLMMLGVLCKPLFDKIKLKLKINDKKFLFRLFQVFRTVLIVMIGFTLFRANSVSDFIYILGNIFKGLKVNYLELGINNYDYLILIVFSICSLIISLINEYKCDLIEKIENSNFIIRWIVYYTLIFIIILAGIYGSGYNAADFIYGGF